MDLRDIRLGGMNWINLSQDVGSMAGSRELS
jgi:hypothetical protein